MASIQTLLLNWYDKNARVLPWRSDPTPYKVWVSEIMLQQTRVETVLPYFERFLASFPDLTSLAAAELEEVLRLWEGLGYYSRARNLHKTARKIVDELDGKIPDSTDALRKLPGIGEYTAAAIASIAFGEAATAIDGNIRRVYARILGQTQPIGTSKFEKEIFDYARSLLPPGRAGDFTQALMDLGATICLPQDPLCERCPLAFHCTARKQGNQNDLPVVPKKAPLPHYDVAAAAILWQDRVLLSRRDPDGVLAGLWEFPGGKLKPTDPSPEAGLARVLQAKTNLTGSDWKITGKIGCFPHAYTHFKITVHAWRAELIRQPEDELAPNLRWVPLADLPSFPMGKVARLISQKIFFLRAYSAGK